MSNHRKTRILLADDEPLVREMLRDYLVGEGYNVTAVASGAEALGSVSTLQPDVILLDMVMPGLSGRDVLAALQGIAPTVPVILMSGNQVMELEGVFAVLTKPFDLGKLVDIVAAAANRRRTPRI